MQNANYIFGIRTVIEAINADKNISKLLIKTNSKSELISELLLLVAQKNIPYQYVPEAKINSLTRKNHQGVLAFISPIEFYSIEDIVPSLFENSINPFILVLDQLTDIRNFGAIVRTAECAGVNAIVIPQKGAASINADAVKTSAGALHVIPVCREKNLIKTVKFLKDSGIQVIAVTEKSEKLYTQSDYTGPVALVLGAEDSGIDPEILRISHEFAKIPVFGKIASLNVSVAAGILMYECIRQRAI